MRVVEYGSGAKIEMSHSVAVGRALVVAHHDWRDIPRGLEAALLSILTG